MKSINEFLDALVNKRMMRDVVGPVRQLRFSGKLAVQNQVGRLDECAFFRQLFDRIAAVPQDSLVAINISDLARAQCRVRERRVVTHHPKIGVLHFHRTQVQRLDRFVRDGKFELPAGTVVGDAQRLAARISRSLTVDNQSWFGRIHGRTLSRRKCFSARFAYTLECTPNSPARGIAFTAQIANKQRSRNTPPYGAPRRPPSSFSFLWGRVSEPPLQPHKIPPLPSLSRMAFLPRPHRLRRHAMPVLKHPGQFPPHCRASQKIPQRTKRQAFGPWGINKCVCSQRRNGPEVCTSRNCRPSM